MESVWSVSKLSTESVGSRRELCSHRRRRRDETRQFRLVGVGGVYWALLAAFSFLLVIHQAKQSGPN